MEQQTEREMQEEPRASNDNRARPPAATRTVKAVARKVGFGDRWREVRWSKKTVFGLMAAAAVLTMIVGFNWGGWVSGGTAQKMVATEAQAAVVSRLVPICVAQYNLDPQKALKLDELKAITSSWDRPNYVKTQGWATMPGEATPDNSVASVCAKLLMDS